MIPDLNISTISVQNFGEWWLSHLPVKDSLRLLRRFKMTITKMLIMVAMMVIRHYNNAKNTFE